MQILYQQRTLKQLSAATSLSMYIDSNLKWKTHISSVIPKIVAIIGTLCL